MSTPDPFNVNSTDPSELIYVSKKNWARKKNVEGNDPLNSMFGRPGPLTGIVLSFIDIIIELGLKCIFYLYDITQYAFDWLNNMIFGNFQDLLPKTFSEGKVISPKFFRYSLNVLLPPFGIALSKGIYGWFSILTCVLLTYINYIIGIIFAFIITSKNRYADQYESYQIQLFKREFPQEQANADISASLSSCGFLIVMVIVFWYIFSFF